MNKHLRTLFSAALMALASHPLAALEPKIQQDQISEHRQNAITRAVSKCSPAIVGITVTEIREQVYRNPYSFDDPWFDRFFGPREFREQYKVKGAGSGFIISEDGYILTNDHVAGTATKVVVTLTNGKKYDAKIIGADAVTDVALLKIDGDNFPYLNLANSENVQVGEWAIAFGNPFGLFDNNAKPTVTVGVVSNTGVNFTQPDNNSDEERVYKGMIQTDAAISSGNSGGPLVNAEGEVIGINTVIYSTAQSSRGAGSIGIGFAIPINRVSAIVRRLKSHGIIDRDFWTGMRLQAIDDEVADYYHLKSREGILVTKVGGNSPADKAGIEPGDIIVAVDGQDVMRTEDINVAILDGEVGQTMKITVDRNGTRKDLSLVLEKQPRGRRD